MASIIENKKFTSAIMDCSMSTDVDSYSLLDNSIEWIRENMTVDKVFDFDTLKMWALENGFKQEE